MICYGGTGVTEEMKQPNTKHVEMKAAGKCAAQLKEVTGVCGQLRFLENCKP